MFSASESKAMGGVNMKRFVLLALSTVTAYCGVASAQRCPVGCQSEIDALENQVAAQEKALNAVPYVQKFTLTPSPDPAHGLSSERELPDYADVLLVHVSVDHKESAVLFPTAQTQPSPSPTFGLNRVILSSKCRDSGGASALAKVDVYLGLLQQEDSSKNAFGVRITVEGCNSTTGQIPVEVAVLRKI
jgi:hypothetical protein